MHLNQSQIGKSLAALLLLSALLLCAGCETRRLPLESSFRATLYTLGDDHQLWSVNARTLAFQNGVPLGGQPVALTFNAARNELYVLLRSPNRVTVINAENNRLVGRIYLPLEPVAMAMSADGRSLYVSCDDHEAQALYQIDLPARQIVNHVRLDGRAATLALSPSGDTILVASSGNNELAFLDQRTLHEVGRIGLPLSPTRIVSLPYGSKSYVLCPASNRVAVVDSHSMKLLMLLPVGPNPDAMALKPDGGELYVANRGGNSLSIIDTSNDEVEGTVLTGLAPSSIAITPDESRMYVANAGSNTVEALDVNSRKLLGITPVGADPEQLQLGPFGRYLYVADRASNDLAVVAIDQPLPTLLTILPTAPHPDFLYSVWFRINLQPAPAPQ